VEQTFVLLEAPRDRRYADELEGGGARVVVADGLDDVAAMAGAADIVQFEFWNHPRLFECLARCPFPAMRSVFWSHISGLSTPVIPPGLIEQAGRFVFTTEASRGSRSVAALASAARENIHVINSGFGFAGLPRPVRTPGVAPVIAYLGTVDFIKMHPGFFDAIDALAGDGIRVSIWGSVNPSGAVAERARAMRHPERIRFGGQTIDPAAALSAAEIFFYPLQRDHYGTAENALVEAMSLGLVPVVLDNPAETAIVRHGQTGMVAQSIEQCVAHLQTLLSSPQLREEISRAASRYVAEAKTPERSAQEFVSLWRALLGEAPRLCDFRQVIGETPAEWFLATQRLPGEAWSRPPQPHAEQPSKGMLAHFMKAFPLDGSLSRLASVA
jgi:glycosyltransferase involved in cell wall biosynthesis